MSENWQHAWDAGVKASEKSLDYVLRLAFKDGYDKGFSEGFNKHKEVEKLTSTLIGQLDETEEEVK